MTLRVKFSFSRIYRGLRMRKRKGRERWGKEEKRFRRLSRKRIGWRCRQWLLGCRRGIGRQRRVTQITRRIKRIF